MAPRSTGLAFALVIVLALCFSHPAYASELSGMYEFLFKEIAGGIFSTLLWIVVGAFVLFKAIQLFNSTFDEE